MSATNRRIAEIYSYYLDERYQDDLSQAFVEWLSTSMYGDELTQLAAYELGVARNDANTTKRLMPDEIRAVWHGELGIPNGITVIVASTELVDHFPNQEFPHGATAIVCQDYALPAPERIRVLLKDSNDEILVRWKRCLL